jgi:hypothetical protein
MKSQGVLRGGVSEWEVDVRGGAEKKGKKGRRSVEWDREWEL